MAVILVDFEHYDRREPRSNREIARAAVAEYRRGKAANAAAEIKTVQPITAEPLADEEFVYEGRSKRPTLRTLLKRLGI